jgi:hypothetical protein
MSLLDSISALVAAGYLGSVIINGNLTPLVNSLKGEIGYVEFVVAFLLLKELSKLPAVGDISKELVATALIAGLIKIATSINKQTFTDFASGKMDLLTFLFSAVKQVGGVQ